MIPCLKKSFVFQHLLFVAIVLLGNSCADKRPEDRVVARVGNKVITIKHLQRSFALEPKWGAGLTKQQALQNQLNYLIDEKLFAQHALELGFDKDEDIAGYLDFISDKELIKALYHQVVEEKVKISDEEYRQAYLDSKKKVRFNYVYTKNHDRALLFFNQLKAAAFDSVRIDAPSGEKKRTTRLMSFGELAEEIEAFVFAMQPGEVHEPIAILDGFMVVQLVDGINEKFTSETDFAVMKNQLRKIIYLRKATPVANQYIKDLMLPKNLTLNPEIFHRLCDVFSKLALENKQEPGLMPVYLSDSALNQLDGETHLWSMEILATYDGGQLTIGQFRARLRNMPAGLRPSLKMAGQIKDAIGVQVRNEFLAKEARKRDLHRQQEVNCEIQIQQDHALAGHYLSREKEQIQVTGQEISNFMVSQDYALLAKKLQERPSKEMMQMILEDFKMSQFKINMSDSLRQKYKVDVDSLLFFSLVPDGKQVIDHDPTPFVVRETFN